MLVGQGADHLAGADLVDLVTVDEAQTRRGGYHDPVEEVLFRDVEHVLHGAELTSRPRNHWYAVGAQRIDALR